MEMSEEKPRVLVLGGVGFIGRNLVKYLVENDLCSYIRVCDKQSVWPPRRAIHGTGYPGS